MKQYIKLNDDGYIIGVSDAPFGGGVENPVELPDGMDLDNMDYYSYLNGQAIIDNKKLSRKREG